MKVICIGLIVSDIIARPVFRDVLDRDSSFLDSLALETGGDAFNVAVHLAVLGEKSELVGRVGEDAFGRNLIKRAGEWKIGTENIKTDATRQTSTSIVLVEPGGERHFLYYGDTNNSLTKEDVNVELFAPGDIVHLGSAMALGGLDGKGVADLFRTAKEKGCITSMDVTHDSTGKWLEKIEEALPFTDIFLPSIYEAEKITGMQEVQDMRNFFARYGLRILVIKMGDKGCYVTDFKEEFFLPAVPVDFIEDTTGAGDSFVAGFLKGICAGGTLRQCAVMGSHIAAASIGDVGAFAGVAKQYGEEEKVRDLMSSIWKSAT